MKDLFIRKDVVQIGLEKGVFEKTLMVLFGST
jgi:hypothetical protein